eukprot:GHRQ01026233.1.p1 GENE.GHRQ01026233.1~~GHRQ01026233.1.p1  ORF type:complete len:128 (+),score=32.08 GHRQ01026233.1:631-1014(+)
MGPLLQHPLVRANFQPPPTTVDVPQVHAVHVVQAIAEIMSMRRPSCGRRRAADQPKEQIEWREVHAILTRNFGVNSVDELCVRLPRGLGHSIVHCVSSWKDERERANQQMQEQSQRWVYQQDGSMIT